MNLEILAPAERELHEAVGTYNLQSEGLGFEFAAEVKRTIGRIVQHSESWARLSWHAP